MVRMHVGAVRSYLQAIPKRIPYKPSAGVTKELTLIKCLNFCITAKCKLQKHGFVSGLKIVKLHTITMCEQPTLFNVQDTTPEKLSEKGKLHSPEAQVIFGNGVF